MNRATRLVGTAVAGFLALALLATLAIGARHALDLLPKSDKPFTSTDWAATPIDERYVFTDDLIGRQLLVGRSEAEVISLLGTAEERLPNPNSGRTELLWQVGWYSVDSMVLSVELDRAGRVRQVRVRES